MRTETVKGAEELKVFLRFVQASGLAIAPESVSKREPPEPDILCTTEGNGQVAFELVEICDPTLARAIEKASEEYIRTSDPSVRILEKKFTRTYQTKHPIELLCYVAGRVVTPDSTIIPTISPWCTARQHPFRRVWLLGRKGVHRVWHAG
jgi:hypothetical protein